MTREIGYYRLPLHLFKSMPRQIEQLEENDLRTVEQKMTRARQPKLDPAALGVDMPRLGHPAILVPIAFTAAMQLYFAFKWNYEYNLPVSSDKLKEIAVIWLCLICSWYLYSRRCIVVFELATVRFWIRNTFFMAGEIIPFHDIREIRAARILWKNLAGYTIIITLSGGKKRYFALPIFTLKTAAWVVELLEFFRQSALGENSETTRDKPDDDNE